jgi:translation elongation factor EF-4
VHEGDVLTTHTGFYDDLKSRSSGYASLDYEEGPLQVADVVQLAIRVNNDPVDAMACMVHRDKAERIGRRMISKLRDILPRQQYQVAIQAVANNKVIARETLSAVRKDVTAKCYGGDISRKKKLLEKQKEGKKRMKRVGSVDIPQDAFVGEFTAHLLTCHPHCAPHVPLCTTRVH